MDFCDGNLGKITNNLLILKFCDDFDIIYRGMRENSNFYWRILIIMREHICSVKALLPYVLSELDHLLVYTEFQSNVAFYCIKTPQKQAVATL